MTLSGSVNGKIVRALALGWLLLLLGAAAGADRIAPWRYDVMLRELPDSPPSVHHWLGTDSVCRDRFSRLLFGTRISLVLAPLAAVLSTLLAALVGGVCGLAPRWLDRGLMFGCELFLAMPWIFLLVSARAMMPLNMASITAALLTFGILGLLGWAGPARVVRARTRELIASDRYLCARALGISRSRVLLVHVPPYLRPILLAQFWLAIPLFILSEANLSLIGLGVPDPLPSWGALLRDFERPEAIVHSPWVLAPLLVLVSTIFCLQTLLRERRPTT